MRATARHVMPPAASVHEMRGHLITMSTGLGTRRTGVTSRSSGGSVWL